METQLITQARLSVLEAVVSGVCRVRGLPTRSHALRKPTNPSAKLLEKLHRKFPRDRSEAREVRRVSSCICEAEGEKGRKGKWAGMGVGRLCE